MKKIISIILVIIWMVIIFLLSNQSGNDSTSTTGLLYKLFGITNDSEFLFILIRKIAHFTEYLILGILVYNMFKSFNVNNILLCTILLCITYSCIDEIHQLFVQGRDCKITDCLIDVLGSLFGLFLIKMKQKFNKRLSKN